MRRIPRLTPFGGLVAVLLAVPASGWAVAPPSEAVRTDIHGDPLPAGAVARLGSVRFLHPDDIGSVAFSPDGGRLAALTHRGEENVLWLWEVPSGKKVERLPLPFPMARDLAYSRDGRFLAVVGGVYVQLLSARTGKYVRSLGDPGQEEVSCAAFSPDGRTMAVGRASRASPKVSEVQLWDVDTGKEVGRLKEHTTPVVAVAFSRDGRRLFSAAEADGSGPGSVCVWEMPAGKLRRRFRHSGRQAVFAPAGDAMAYTGTDDGEVRLWDLDKGKERARLRGKPLSYVFSPDGKRLLTEGNERAVCVWEAATGKRLQPIPGNRGGGLKLCALSADGKLLASVGSNQGSRRAVRLWDVAARRELRPLEGHVAPVTCLALAEAGRAVLSGSIDGTVRVWEVSGREVRVYAGHERAGFGGWVTNLAVAGDGRAVASGDVGRHVRVWDRASGKELRHFRPRPAPSETRWRGISFLTFSADSKRLLGGRDQDVVLMEAGGTGGVPKWEAATERRLDTVPGVGFPFVSDAGGQVVVSWGNLEPDGRSDLLLWRVPRGAMISRFEGLPQGGMVENVHFSPDGKLLAADHRLYRDHRGRGGIGVTRVYEAATGGKIRELRPGGRSLALSPDGGILALGSEEDDGLLRLVDPLTGEERARLPGHSDLATCCAFSADGRFLFSGGCDRTVLVWDLARVRLRRTPDRVDASARGLEALWAELASADAARGYAAVRRLAAVPTHSVPLLRARLRPAARVAAAEIERHLNGLASEEFAEREWASAALARLGERAAPALGRLLTEKPSLEVYRRADRLLARAEREPLTAGRLRELRAVAVLERAGGAEARRVLEGLAKGAPGARLTEEAKAALRRRGADALVFPGSDVRR
jgi:WD40 repeat protein